MKIKLISSLLFIVLLFSLVISADDEFDYDKEINELKTTGKITPTLAAKIGELSDSQRTNIILEMVSFDNAKSLEFWKSWNQMQSSEKQNLWKKLSSAEKTTFIAEYSDNAGFSFNGIDESVKFGSGGAIGGLSGFFDVEKIKEYNSNSEDPIIEVEYINDEGKRGFKFKKKSGAYAELVTSEQKNGFYFNPSSGEIKFIDKDGKLSKDHFLSGNWNGKGNIKIDVSGDEAKIELDFERDDEGNVIDSKTKFASFKNSKGVRFSSMTKLTDDKDKDGKKIVLTEKAEFTFNEDGRPKKVSMGYMKGDAIGGSFGRNVDIFYTVDDFNSLSDEQKAELGNFVIYDAEKKFLKTNLKVSEGGGIVLGNLEKIRDVMRSFTNEQKEKIMETEGLEARKKLIEKFGVAMDEWDNAMDGLVAVGTVGRLLSGDVTALTEAEFLVDTIKSWTDDYEILKENPLAVAAIPGREDFLSLEIRNDEIKNLNDIRMGGGRLSIEDDNGKMTTIVDSSTKNGYRLKPDLKKDNPQFSKLGFFLTSVNNPKQQISVFFDKETQAIQTNGVDSFKNLAVVGSESFAVTAYTKEHKVFRADITHQTDRELFKVQMSADQELTQIAREKLALDKKEWERMHAQFYIDEKIDASEAQELKEFERTATTDYYRKLGEKDVFVLFEATGESTQESLAESQGKIADDIESYFESFENAPSTSFKEQLNSFPREAIELSVGRVLSDTSLQDQMASRGIVNKDSFMAALKVQIHDAAEFIRDAPSGKGFEFQADTKNKVYKIIYGNDNQNMRVFNVDPVFGPIIAENLPMILGSGEQDSKGNLVINTQPWKGRFDSPNDRNVYVTWTSDITLRDKFRGIFQYGLKGAKEGLKQELLDETALKLPGWLDTFLRNSHK